jgi:hypothetical protein
MWQDIALSIFGLGFTVVLIPQLIDAFRGGIKMNCWTCALTTIGCFGVAIVDSTLALYYAAIVSTLTGIMWLLLLIYSIKNGKEQIT